MAGLFNEAWNKSAGEIKGRKTSLTTPFPNIPTSPSLKRRGSSSKGILSVWLCSLGVWIFFGEGGIWFLLLFRQCLVCKHHLGGGWFVHWLTCLTLKRARSGLQKLVFKAWKIFLWRIQGRLCWGIHEVNACTFFWPWEKLVLADAWWAVTSLSHGKWNVLVFTLFALNDSAP